jgi:hypothetical protein
MRPRISAGISQAISFTKYLATSALRSNAHKRQNRARLSFEFLYGTANHEANIIAKSKIKNRLLRLDLALQRLAFDRMRIEDFVYQGSVGWSEFDLCVGAARHNETNSEAE